MRPAPICCQAGQEPPGTTLPTPHPVDLRQRVRSRHIREGSDHGPDRILGLGYVVFLGCLGFGEGAADDGL